jgi:hypothetical protein
MLAVFEESRGSETVQEMSEPAGMSCSPAKLVSGAASTNIRRVESLLLMDTSREFLALTVPTIMDGFAHAVKKSSAELVTKRELYNFVARSYERIKTGLYTVTVFVALLSP